MRSFKDDYKLTFSAVFGNNRRFKSPTLLNNVIDLSNSTYLIYSIDMITNPLNNITFINGIESDFFYLEVKSDGTQLTWANNIYWANEVLPISSVSGMKDVYKILCINPEKFLGEYAYGFNY